MVDLLPVLLDATRTARRQMAEWFAQYPPGRAWTVVSDYCIDDRTKKNDVFSFVVIANHDTATNICDYIAKVAPRDIKETSRVPLGLVQYLTCQVPVTFSISFVIDRSSALLRNYLRLEHMASFIPDVRVFIEQLRQNSLVDPAYYDEALPRFDAFGKDLARKQVSEKLARQIHLASGFAATMFHLVSTATQAADLRWISDRDALIERHDGVVYDLAFLYSILMEAHETSAEPDEQGRLLLNNPRVRFELPEKCGQHRYDDLVRLPDYLAGTLADLDTNTMSWSKQKFGQVLQHVFVNSPNNWVVQMSSTADEVVARSAQFRTL